MDLRVYPDLVDKAAVLIVRLAKNHPLPDATRESHGWHSGSSSTSTDGVSIRCQPSTRQSRRSSRSRRASGTRSRLPSGFASDLLPGERTSRRVRDTSLVSTAGCRRWTASSSSPQPRLCLRRASLPATTPTRRNPTNVRGPGTRPSTVAADVARARLPLRLGAIELRWDTADALACSARCAVRRGRAARSSHRPPARAAMIGT